jgi:hypothetical protein
MMVTDPSIATWVEANAPALHTIAPIAGAIFVVAAGKLIERLQARRRAEVGAETAGHGGASH